MSKNTPPEWQEVFREELEVVKQRHSGEGALDENLVGLAVSGGGIRSATFALGVLEALKENGWLPKIDYLSTVSGGGYIGAWLSANCKRSAEHKEADWLGKDASWKLSIDHLRRYSNYLSPVVGFLSADTWSMVAIWVRNTFLVQLIVILAIAVALLVPRPLFVAFEYWPRAGEWRWIAILLFILGVVGIAGNQLQSGKNKVPFLRRQSWLKGFGIAVLLLAAALGVGVPSHFRPFSGAPVDPSVAAAIALLLVTSGFCLQPVAVMMMNRFWWGKYPPDEINYNQGWVQYAVVIPMMATGFLVAAIMWGESKTSTGFGQWCTFAEFFRYGWKDIPFQLLIVFVSLWVLSFCSIPIHTGKYIAVAFFAPVPAIVILHAMLCGVMYLFHGWTNTGPEADWRAFVWGPALVLYSFGFTIVILLGILGRQSTEGMREWWSRFGAWLGIYGFAWMVINVVAAYGPLVTGLVLTASSWMGASVGGGWIGTTIAGLFAGKSNSTGGKPGKPNSSTTREVLARVAPIVFIAGLLIAVSAVLHVLITLNSDLTWNVGETGAKYWGELSDAKLPVTFSVFGACLLCVALFAARVDINIFGLNAFYRNRLVRCYLGATRFRDNERNPQKFTGFDDDDDMALSNLAATTGPLHIVNCALNLGGSTDLALHTRHSANFTLTPFRCGSRYRSRNPAGVREEIGYIPTAAYGGHDGQPTLGQAIAVSGAAASPNMGYHTSPVVAFLLTLFNVRLGWWFPNPHGPRTDSPSPWFSLTYLVKELFGGADDRSKYLAISDGGHFENLAAYELVKRKCRVIIVSDAECDPELRFEGLGALIRMCDVDFGVKITIDVGSIRPQADSPWSGNRCAVGKIDYGPDHPAGKLIYFKASMNGHENTSILQYKATHPTFPHESTGDQFYGEDQFESYRRLGRDIAALSLHPVEKESTFPALADKLEKICSPTLHNIEQFSQQSARLMNIWSRLGATADFKFLDDQLAASWPKNAPADFRSGYYLCLQLLQLMENVYLELRLEETWHHPDNAGWRNLFIEWAGSRALRQTWEMTAHTYGQRFQFFCERHLHLPRPK